MELGERLARIGIGGYYRTIDIPGSIEVIGPYPKRGMANPAGEGNLGMVSVYVEFHLKKPVSAKKPDPNELVKMK